MPRRKDGVANDARYYHIGMFLEQADDDEADNLWKLVGAEADVKVQSREAFWLSTDGFSVPWLHVRLDEGPYIHHPEYKPPQ